MYDNPCKHCENFGHCMPMMNMPMYGYHIPVIDDNDDDDDDDDLKKLYPKLYIRTYPMVKHHCDMMESRFGTMYCPTKDEMDRIAKEIYEKYEEYHKDDDDDDRSADEDEDMRQRRRRGRRRSVEDLIKILFIRDLHGRRRRRRRPHYGYHNYGYWY